MKKAIILPTYDGDLVQAKGWCQKYIDNPSLGELLIYEKDDSLDASSPTTKAVNGNFKIPNVGRSSYAFLRYVCDNYENLADFVCLTKPHLQKLAVEIDHSLFMCHQYHYFEFWNNLRCFVWIHKDLYVPMIQRWLHLGFKIEDHNGWAYVSEKTQNVSLVDLFDPMVFKAGSGIWDVEGKQKIYISSERWENKILGKMKSIWPDWEIPKLVISRQEACWSVSKKLILHHPKDLYKKMMDDVHYHPGEQTGWPWNMYHDEWGQFWTLFWETTAAKVLQK